MKRERTVVIWRGGVFCGWGGGGGGGGDRVDTAVRSLASLG